MAQAARLASRLQRELTMLHSDPPPGVSAWPCHDHLLTHLQAQIHGPQGTVYSNGIFKLDIQVPERYPFEPPNIKFITPVYHPNIDNGGRICLDILNLPPKGAWRPSLNLSTLLASIGLLLAEPNPDDGLMGEITAEYKHDRPSFDRKARKWTELYAGQDQLTSELNEPKSSSCSETNQKLAPVRSNSQEPLQVAPSKGPEAIITKCDSFSQPLRPGLSLNKRLALDRGTTCLQQNKPTSSNVSHVNFNPVVHAVASKEIMSPLEKEDTGLQAPSCRKHSSKELAIREEQSKDDLASETAKVTSLDKKKSSSHVDRNSPHNEERSSCRNLSKGLFHEMAAGKSNAVLDASFPNASLVERATEVGKGPQLDEGCTPSVSISAKVRSNDMGNVSEDKNSRKKVEDWKDIASIGKENQIPKHCPALKPGTVISSQSAGRKEMVEITLMEPSGVVNSATVFNNINHEPGKEKGYVCLPLRTKSLKLARAKPDSQPFQSVTSQQNMQSIPVAKKWSSPPIIIPDDIPTVVVSDSGSDSELSDEGFTLSLTQRSFRNKRKAGSNLR